MLHHRRVVDDDGGHAGCGRGCASSGMQAYSCGRSYQLPPIGAGCPFVDITSYLQTHRSNAVAELTVSRRQQDVDRTDSQLAAGQRAVFSKGSSRSMAGRNSRRLCGDARGVSIWNEAARRHQGHQRKARADRPFVRARAWAPLYANGE
jgi:ATP-dependent exoDNAse (exonuclease V) alpha subunit